MFFSPSSVRSLGGLFVNICPLKIHSLQWCVLGVERNGIMMPSRWEPLIDRGWCCLLEIIHDFAPMMLSEIFHAYTIPKLVERFFNVQLPRPHARHQMLLAAYSIFWDLDGLGDCHQSRPGVGGWLGDVTMHRWHERWRSSAPWKNFTFFSASGLTKAKGTPSVGQKFRGKVAGLSKWGAFVDIGKDAAMRRPSCSNWRLFLPLSSSS